MAGELPVKRTADACVRLKLRQSKRRSVTRLRIGSFRMAERGQDVVYSLKLHTRPRLGKFDVAPKSTATIMRKHDDGANISHAGKTIRGP